MMFQNWIKPRSTEPEEAFRERLIRIGFFIVLALNATSFFFAVVVFETEWAWVSNRSFHLYSFIVSLLIPLALWKRKIILAGLILVLVCCLGQGFLGVLARIDQSLLRFVISPTGFMVTPVFTALVLPSRYIMRLTYLAIVALLAVYLLPYAPDFAVMDFSASHYAGSYAGVLWLEGFLLVRVAREAERRYYEAEKAHQAQGAFLRLVNHELRTPLNSIIPLLDMYINQFYYRLEAKEKEYLDYIRKNVNHLNSLVTKILNISKFESSGFQLQREDTPIDDLLREAMKTLEPQLHPDVQLCEDLNATVSLHVDSTLLMEVFLNILGNAVKFTEQGTVTVRSSAEQERVTIEIRDTGCGIADPSAVFREFGQTAEGKKRGGTGLGMPIAKRLVELHGGTIRFNSVVGQGTSFYIELPR
jgi:signal transduction histidine kinase